MLNRNFCLKISGIVIFTTIGLVSIPSISPCFAQTTDNSNNAIKDLKTNDNPDVFSNRDQGQGVFDMLHRYRMRNKKNMSEFSQEQNQMILDEAAQFRAKQRQLIQQSDKQETPK